MVNLGSIPKSLQIFKNKKIMKILKNIYKWFIGIFTEPVLNYEAANSIAKFGIILDDKSKLKNAIQHINSLIRFKSESKDKSLILEITDSQHDYRSILSELKQNYLNLKFIVEEVEIMGEKYLFISWKDKI